MTLWSPSAQPWRWPQITQIAWFSQCKSFDFLAKHAPKIPEKFELQYSDNTNTYKALQIHTIQINNLKSSQVAPDSSLSANFHLITDAVAQELSTCFLCSFKRFRNIWPFLSSSLAQNSIFATFSCYWSSCFQCQCYLAVFTISKIYQQVHFF